MTTVPCPDLTATQLFSRSGLGFLWNKRTELDPGQAAILQSMWNNKKKGSVECQQTITYKLSKTRAGNLGYGRYYGTKGSLETLERECRGTLCKDYYYDIDIVNCHPVLLEQFAHNLHGKDLPEVSRLCQNRDEFLRNVGGTRDEAKTEIIRILYGGHNTNEYLGTLSNEVRSFSKFLSTRPEHAELFKYCKTQDNIYGTFLSFILQTEERKCMLAMKCAFESRGWSVDVLAYDGVMIRRREGPDVIADMREVEKQIQVDTGYAVSLLIKDFVSFDMPQVGEELEKGVSREAYNEMKGRFEQTNFYYEPTNEMISVGDKDLQRMTIEHAREAYSRLWRFEHSTKFQDYTTFFDIWRKDKTARTVKTIQMGSEPSSNPTTFVMIPKLAWEQASPGNGLDVFLQLVKLKGSAEQQLYIISWLAHMIQKPFDLPGVALIITGVKGSGKDTLFDFLMQFVVGSDYSFNYGSNEQFFNGHDTGRQNKFLCKLEEANRGICLRNADKLKSLITNQTEVFNPKCQKAITFPNYNRFVFTTNGACPVEMSNGERRFVIASCSNAKVGDREWWNRVRKELFTPEAGAAVGHFLSTYDITGFDPRILPVCEMQTAIIEAEQTSEEAFVEQWDGQPATATELFLAYRQFCAAQERPHAQNVSSFGIRLLVLIRDGLIFKKRNNDGQRYCKAAFL